MTPKLRNFVAGVATLALVVPGLALASTAANTKISNTASVDYKDAGGASQAQVVSLPADITVNLVAAAPNLSSPPDVSIDQGTSASLTYTITSTANGPDIYNITVSDVLNNLTAGAAPTFPASINTLGGTTLAAAAAVGAATITVPYDQDLGGVGSVNGLAPGDIIVINSVDYKIAAGGIAKNAGANTATITLDAGYTHPTITTATPIGAIVGERQTFTVQVPSGTVSGGNSGTHTFNTTATANTNPKPATTQGTPTVITVNRAVLTITKEVSTDGTNFSGAVNAPPGATLTYRISVHNGGATNAAAVKITDTVPQFLTYVAGSCKTAASVTDYGSASAVVPADLNVAGATLTYTSPAALGANGYLVFYFQATIN